MKRSILILALLLAGCGEYSDGDRVGIIQKLSKKGLIAKTWEGEMMLGGLRKKTTSSTDSQGETHYSTSMVANLFEFTIEDERLVKVATEAMSTGSAVRIHYRQEYIANPFRTHTGVLFPYFVTRIEGLQ